MSAPSQADHFGAWVASVSRLLSAYREHTGTTSDHGDTLGKAREVFISEVLRRFLPQALHVGSGQIVDGDGHLSRQIDVLIYRHDMPLLSSLADTNLYFAEGVVATVEVKSKMDAPALRRTLENCRSVKMLNVAFPSRGSTPGDFMDLRYFAPATYAFGYLGYSKELQDLKKVLFDWIRESQVDSLSHLPEIIATQGCVVIKNDYRCFDSNAIRRRCGYEPMFLAAQDSTPLRWLLHHLLWQIGGDVSRVLPNRSIAELLGRSHLQREALEERAEFWGRWDRDGEAGRILCLDDEDGCGDDGVDD